MKIIQVYQTDPLQKDQGGGVRYVRNLTESLLQNDVSVKFLGVGEVDYKVNNLEFYKVDYKLKGYLSFGLRLFKYATSRNNLEGNIVHVHRLYYGLPFSLFKKMTGCKVICTLHGRTFEVFKDSNPSLLTKITLPLFYAIEYLSLKLTDQVIPVSQDVVNSFNSKYPSLISKISTGNNIIPSMINVSDYASLLSRNESLKELGLSGSYQYICFVGRFAKVKDIPFIIELVRKNESFFLERALKVVLCGGGEEYDEIKNLVDLYGLNSIIHMTGVVEPEKIKHVYNASKLTLICSKHEAAPTILIESIAAKTPVISNDVGDVRDVLSIGNVGIIVEKNAEDYLQAIQFILENDDFFNEINAKKIIKSRSRDTVANLYLKKYEELINK